MTSRRANPEHKLQCAVREFLTYCLPLPGSPDYVEWTASLTGAHLGVNRGGRAKAAGVRRGWPDLQFLLPDGRTVYIELKTPTGSLSPEQRAFRDRCAPHGIFALCRSVDDVEAALRGWGVKLRAHPFDPKTYDTEAQAPSPSTSHRAWG